MADRKTEFWWASIAGADPEPVEKTEHEGRPCVYTIGCADPFYLDDPNCLAQLMTTTPNGDWVLTKNNLPFDIHPLRRPIHPDKPLAERAAIAAERAATPRGRGPVWHGWRGPR